MTSRPSRLGEVPMENGIFELNLVGIGFEINGFISELRGAFGVEVECLAWELSKEPRVYLKK